MLFSTSNLFARLAEPEYAFPDAVEILYPMPIPRYGHESVLLTRTKLLLEPPPPTHKAPLNSAEESRISMLHCCGKCVASRPLPM